MNLIERAISTGAILRSQSKYAKEDYRAALDVLVRAFKSIGLDRPATKSSILMNLFYAELAERNLEYEDSYRACLVVKGQIEEPARRPRNARQREDARYVLFRCKWLLARLSERCDKSLSIANSISVSFSSLRLELVSPFLKSMFPISKNIGRLIDEKLSGAND